ncbi:unnamed protein product [Ophioblennius macclurei]
MSCMKCCIDYFVIFHILSGHSAADDEDSDKKADDDVTYASIDHISKTSNRVRRDSDNDCDYTMVKIPTEQQATEACSAKDDADDDYVLMS